jgi:hypothetical protein
MIGYQIGSLINYLSTSAQELNRIDYMINFASTLFSGYQRTTN